jgi:hypothetical protein
LCELDFGRTNQPHVSAEAAEIVCALPGFAWIFFLIFVRIIKFPLWMGRFYHLFKAKYVQIMFTLLLAL